MKINSSDYYVIQRLNDGVLGKIQMFEEDISTFSVISGLMADSFRLYAPEMRKNIYLPTKPFSEAMGRAAGSLVDDIVFEGSGNNAGVILNCPLFYGKSMLLYHFTDTDKTFFLFMDGVIHSFGSYNISKHIDIVAVSTSFKNAENFKNMAKGGMSLVELIGGFIHTTIIAYINFLKYAEIETKNLPPKSRIKDINCKYINETASKITILDSKWFTNLVQSNEFNVRGHFRLQPYGEGLTKKKLIYINEFTKHGYTSKAKKLLVQ